MAEVLSVLITPEPLDKVAITDKAQKLAPTQVAAWEKQWSTQVGSVELEDGAGKAWTREEKEAGANRNVVLRASSLPSQSLLPRAAPARRPMLLRCTALRRRVENPPLARPIAVCRRSLGKRSYHHRVAGVRWKALMPRVG